MDTVNLILMIILSAMIGFAIGNVWGKATMKQLFSDLMAKLTEGLKAAAGKDITSNNKKE